MNLTGEVKDLYSEIPKTLMKETEDDTNGKLPCSRTGILLKCPYYTKQSTDSM